MNSNPGRAWFQRPVYCLGTHSRMQSKSHPTEHRLRANMSERRGLLAFAVGVILVFAGCSKTTPPVITSSGTASGTVGTAFSYQITATDSPTRFGATGLPA